MVDAYNTTAEETKADHPACEIKAAWGDMSRIREPAYLMEGASVTLDDCQDVDLLAMCLAVDFFGCGEGLMRGLGQPLWYLKQSGTILIIDIEKCDGPGLEDDVLDGEKSTGNSSQVVVAALRGWGVEDIEVIHERFKTEVIKGTTFSRNELYFIIRAKKGERSQELLSEYE